MPKNHFTVIQKIKGGRFLGQGVLLLGRRAFAVRGPMVWNSLPDDLSAQQDYESIRQGLKTWLFSRY